MLFRLDNLGKEFSGEWLFRGITVQCNSGNRIGLIGRNGCGKTTLFDLIEGRLPADEGNIHRASGLCVSRVQQIPNFPPDATPRGEALKVFDALRSIEVRVRELEGEMSALSEAIPKSLADEYETLRVRLTLEGGYDYEARTEAVLMGLGFTKESLDAPCARLSGGQQNRLLLAKALLQPAELLLLDEPTNHLDLQGILWLTGYLAPLRLSFLIISHDRQFLDALTTRTWEIEGGRLYDYPGNFTRARRLKAEKNRLQEKEYQRQQQWKSETEDFIRRNIAGQKTKQAQSRRKLLDRTDWIEKPFEETENLKLKIRAATRGGALSFWIEEGTVGFPAKPLIEGINLRLGRGDRIGFLGANGSGKTTLLRTLLGETPLLKGKLEWGANNCPAYYSQNPDLGNGGRTVYDCLRDLDSVGTDLELRNFAGRFLFKDDDIYKSVNQLSGGERSRLALARLLFHPANVLILDEPTNHLDILSREALEAALNDYGGTLVVVSHDRYFLKQVVSDLYLIRNRRLAPVDSMDQLLLEEPSTERSRLVPPVKPKSIPSAAIAAKSPLSKNERQRRERKLLELEARIEALETRKKEVLAALQTDYENFSRLHELSEQHQHIELELRDLYLDWEELTQELSIL